MRALAFVTIALGLLAAPALAAEKAAIVRAGELKDRPFVDAATVQPVAPNQAVTVLIRQGAWAQIDAGGAKGWVRVLNLRLDGAQPQQGGGGLSSAASLFRTGSSGKTVTTGVKGMGEAELRNAVPNEAQLAQLDTFAVSPADARTRALQSHLTESNLPYIDKAKSK